MWWLVRFRGLRVGFLVLALCGGIATEAAAAEPAPAREVWRFGAGAGAGIGLFQGDIPGPWLEALALARWAPQDSLYFKGQLALSYSTHSESKSLDYDGDFDDDPNTDRRTLASFVSRILIGYEFTRRFAIEGGAFAGPGWSTLSSTQCGDSRKTGLTWGGSAGPAIAVGARNELELALHMDIAFMPVERCTNSSDASFEAGLPPSPHRHAEDDGQFAFVLRAHYLF